jgi:hypothetical protein
LADAVREYGRGVPSLKRQAECRCGGIALPCQPQYVTDQKPAWRIIWKTLQAGQQGRGGWIPRSHILRGLPEQCRRTNSIKGRRRFRVCHRLISLRSQPQHGEPADKFSTWSDMVVVE